MTVLESRRIRLNANASKVAVDEHALDPEIQWWRWSARHPVGALLIVGVIATQVATTMGYFLPAVKLPQLPWPVYTGALQAPGSAYGSAGSFFVGEFTHFLNGVAFAFIFGTIVYAKLPFSFSAVGNVLKALLFGVILTALSCGVLVPYVFEPHKGYGFMSFTGPTGWKLPLAILVWHMVYAVHLAALFNPARSRQAHLASQGELN